MQVFDKVAVQVESMKLPVVAVSLTAVPRTNTPVLLMVHWHGFAPDTHSTGRHPPPASLPGSALQISDTWHTVEELDSAMLDAAWQFGAWDLLREERRGCNTAGASEREALECKQAFAEHPFGGDSEELMVSDAPDREDLMQLGARVGYVRWMFRPVKGGLWQDTAVDDTLNADGGRALPCPVPAKPRVGPRQSRTRYALGHSSRIVLL